MAFSIALAGCYSPQPAPGAPCGPDDVCPSGLVCTLGTCELTRIDAPGMPNDAVDAPIDVPPGTPVVMGIAPAQGIVGTVITIAGANFGETEGRLDLAGVTMTVDSWSDSMIVATVPDVYPHAAQLTVTRESQLSASAPFTVVLPPAVYISNDVGSPDTVSVMTFDPLTTTLTPLGMPVSKSAAAVITSGCQQTLTVNERTRRVFTTANDALAVFNIDPRTGGLTHVGTTSIPSGRGYGVQSNAAGTRVYVASPNQKRIAGFEVSAAGALTNLPGSPYDANSEVTSLTFSNDESFLYASVQNGGLTTFTVAANGSLVRVGNLGTNDTLNLGRRPNTGQLFLVGGGLISVYSTPAGLPSAVAGSPFIASTLNGPPIFDPTNDRLYVPRDGSGQVFAFDLATTGAPTALDASPFSVGPGQLDFSCGAISRDGTFLVVAGEVTEEVNLYRLAPGGEPTAVVGSPFEHSALNSDASGMAITF